MLHFEGTYATFTFSTAVKRVVSLCYLHYDCRALPTLQKSRRKIISSALCQKAYVKKREIKKQKSVWFPNLGFIDPGVLLAYIIILILSTKEFRKEKQVGLKYKMAKT